jgi:hypothetical protein
MSENASASTWLDRLIDERMWVVGNVEKLRVFMASDAFSTATYTQQTLMHRQLACMNRYLDVLDERIAAGTAAQSQGAV